MWYAILSKDVPNSLALRLKERGAHRKRLNALKNEGRLFLAGPFPSTDSENPGEEGFSGSLIVAEFNSLQDAVDWADKDPYNLAGVYENFKVKPFIKVLP